MQIKRDIVFKYGQLLFTITLGEEVVNKSSPEDILNTCLLQAHHYFDLIAKDFNGVFVKDKMSVNFWLNGAKCNNIEDLCK